MSGGVSGGAEAAALTAMVAQLQAQVQAMGERMEQQQATIRLLTAELQRPAKGSPGATSPGSHGSPPGSSASASARQSRTSPSMRQTSASALHAVVAAVTKTERNAGLSPGAGEGAYDDDNDDDDAMGCAADAPALSMDPGSKDPASGMKTVGDTGVGGRGAAPFGDDIYDEVPRILFEPDDDDDDDDVDGEGEGGGAHGMEYASSPVYGMSRAEMQAAVLGAVDDDDDLGEEPDDAGEALMLALHDD